MQRIARLTHSARVLWLALTLAACPADDPSDAVDAVEQDASGPFEESHHDASRASDDDAGKPPAEGTSVNGAAIETVTIEARKVSTGLITLKEPYPVLLLRDGSACLNINVVASNDLEAHRKENPRQWLSWKRVDGKISLLWADGWAEVAFGGEVAPQRRGFRLAGSYTYVRSVGVGTSVSIKERTFVFSNEGRFVFAATGVFSVGSAETNQVFGGSFPPEQRGTYEIDGYVMRLHYDSGTSEVTSFVYEGDGDIIYVGGTWYDLN